MLPFESSKYLEQIADFVSSLLTPEALLSASVLTAIVGFVGRMAWSGATAVLRWFHSWRLRSVQSHTIALAKTRLPFDASLIAPHCLVIRYGTDKYIQHMASDRERHDGRLQNRKLKVPVTLNADGFANFKLRIPIHKRLGTQFKCFVDIKDETKVGEVMDFLARCPSVLEPEVSSSAFHRTRIFFLLKDFAILSTVDGLKNNMCYPH